MFKHTAFIGALRAISLGFLGNKLDFRRDKWNQPPPMMSVPPKPPRRRVNLRLELGPSDPGRLMRNRTPDPSPVRLSCHDWFRRKLVGSSKRIENMTPEEKTRFLAALKEFNDGNRAKSQLR